MFYPKLRWLLAFLSLSPLSAIDIPLFVEDMANLDQLPKRFRMMPQDLPKENPIGTSGSAQFSKKSFQKIVETIGTPKELYLVDLREESHGFLNGIAVSWYYPENRGNAGKSLSDIMATENSLLEALQQKKEVELFHIVSKDGRGYIDKATPEKIPVLKAETEERAFPKVHYLRLPVLDHHAPSPTVLQAFLGWFMTIPKGSWIHFHCRGGAGRTTLFMAMVEILQNGNRRSLEDIVKEQKALGGTNLLAKLPEYAWKYEANEQRRLFLEEFYREFAGKKRAPSIPAE